MPVQLTMYSRTGCHLCEDMKNDLFTLAVELGFITEVILIDNNNELERAYGESVPVLMLGEELICEHFLDRAALVKSVT
jgi:glutaredoxin